MTISKMATTSILTVLLSIILSIGQGAFGADETGSMTCSDMIVLLQEHNSKNSAELRRIQREIAALRADLDEPGFQDIFSGIGYILGLFGVAAFVASRRKKLTQKGTSR